MPHSWADSANFWWTEWYTCCWQYPYPVMHFLTINTHHFHHMLHILEHFLPNGECVLSNSIRCMLICNHRERHLPHYVMNPKIFNIMCSILILNLMVLKILVFPYDHISSEIVGFTNNEKNTSIWKGWDDEEYGVRPFEHDYCNIILMVTMNLRNDQEFRSYEISLTESIETAYFMSTLMCCLLRSFQLNYAFSTALLSSGNK